MIDSKGLDIKKIKSIYRTVRMPVINSVNRFRVIGKNKIFCIGRNKTGTTSVKAAMKELGFIVGHQRTAEMLSNNWAKRDFKKLIRYCRTAQFFQDVPFSRPFTFVVLDHEFPNSKFILTIRDSPEQWYSSLTRFHGRLWGKNGRIPTKEDLQNATYLRKGSPWDSNRHNYTTSEDDPYNKEILIKHYNDYNNSVIEYFRHRPDDLLVLNVAEDHSYKKLCEFLNVTCQRENFPWVNKTN